MATKSVSTSFQLRTAPESWSNIQQRWSEKNSTDGNTLAKKHFFDRPPKVWNDDKNVVKLIFQEIPVSTGFVSGLFFVS